MRLVIRIAIALSVLAVLITVLGSLEAVHDLNEAFPGEPETSAGVGLLYGLLFSLVPLILIWLGVFVVYVVARGCAPAMKAG